jgi:hypothetical protein
MQNLCLHFPLIVMTVEPLYVVCEVGGMISEAYLQILMDFKHVYRFFM